MFNDGSAFNLRLKKNRLCEWQDTVYNLHQKFIVPTSEFGYHSFHGLTLPVGIVGCSNRHTCRVIIDNHIILFTKDIQDGPALFVLQEDNCRTKRPKIIGKYLSIKILIRMNRPA